MESLLDVFVTGENNTIKRLMKKTAVKQNLAATLAKGVSSFGMFCAAFRKIRLKQNSLKVLYGLFLDVQQKAQNYFYKVLKDCDIIDYLVLDKQKFKELKQKFMQIIDYKKQRVSDLTFRTLVQDLLYVRFLSIKDIQKQSSGIDLKFDHKRSKSLLKHLIKERIGLSDFDASVFGRMGFSKETRIK